ncbi:Cof-type HAD-IIB family hydrolase [Salinithrix halophila]|uniref:Cof-type HAD-IIB family hydrolase n=1 Tax=Salinithrix halophila TaxID=1485204 RepID=A0ABV8JF76_9BACL
MSNLAYPLFVSDIDGTLVTEFKAIPAANRASIAEFRQRGGQFTLATGRSFAEAKRFIEELHVELPVILCNGGILFDPQSNTLTPVATIDRDIVFDALAHLRRIAPPIDIFIYTTELVYATGISPATQAAVEAGVESGEFPLEIVSSYDRLPQVPWIKLVVVADNRWMPDLHRWAETTDYPLEFVQSSDNYFEILPRGISKGNAVRALTETLDLTPASAAVIGDHLNDLSMVRVAGKSAAVANAHPHLIQAADHIMPSNEEAGVSQFIDNHVLIPTETAQKR